MEYSICDYRASDLVRLDVKINYELATPMASIIHRDKAQSVGRRLCASLKELIPRQMFKIPIQACVGVKVIASEHISPVRKDVLAKCYGGGTCKPSERSIVLSCLLLGLLTNCIYFYRYYPEEKAALQTGKRYVNSQRLNT
jgi:hypothetical protein